MPEHLLTTPAGIAVVTFTPGKDESCPLDHCVINVALFDDPREANDYVHGLDPDGIYQFPHVVPAYRNGGGADA